MLAREIPLFSSKGRSSEEDSGHVTSLDEVVTGDTSVEEGIFRGKHAASEECFIPGRICALGVKFLQQLSTSAFGFQNPTTAGDG
jgi:hypothetical protein